MASVLTAEVGSRLRIRNGWWRRCASSMEHRRWGMSSTRCARPAARRANGRAIGLRDVPDMNSPPSLIDLQELSFQLYDVLDVEALTRRTWFADHDRATFDSALETVRTLAEEQFRPHHRKSDLEEAATGRRSRAADPGNRCGDRGFCPHRLAGGASKLRRGRNASCRGWWRRPVTRTFTPPTSRPLRIAF